MQEDHDRVNLRSQQQQLFSRFLNLFGKFITVTKLQIFPIHEQYIKYFSVSPAFYDSSVIKHRKVSSVGFSKMKVNVVIFIASVNLFPDACFNLLLLIFSDQIAEPFLSKPE